MNRNQAKQEQKIAIFLRKRVNGKQTKRLKQAKSCKSQQYQKAVWYLQNYPMYVIVIGLPPNFIDSCVKMLFKSVI